jgi:signal transduction histidine kinase
MRAHAGLFTRVLHALYENAVHASAPRAPSIVTQARATPSKIVLLVSDDGPGVPAALAPRIFDALVTGRRGGSGLGLAMAKRIVAAHGGTIELTDAPGVPGATFRIELPA